MKNKINVMVVHPTESRNIIVKLDAEATPTDILARLIADDFLNDLDCYGGYQLFDKDACATIKCSQTMASSGVKCGSLIKIIPFSAIREG